MSDTRSSYLVVRLAGSLCALPLEQVVETCRVPVMTTAAETTVPGLLGFATLRGVPVAVLELAALLGMEASASSPGRRLVCLRMDGAPAAFAVDSVVGIESVSDRDITRIALPGGQERALAPLPIAARAGTLQPNAAQASGFDRALARLLDACTLAPELPPGVGA